MHTNIEAGRQNEFAITHHAEERMCERSISLDSVRRVLEYGRRVHTRGAVCYVVGRKEVYHHMKQGRDLRPAKNLHVVCGEDGAVITVYRNEDFRQLKPQRRRAA
jgi:hypothetical protein